jgi:hypothetical protein
MVLKARKILFLMVPKEAGWCTILIVPGSQNENPG